MSTEQLLRGASTLVDIAIQRAEARGAEVAYTFLVDGESEEATLTFGALDRRARAIGAALQEMGAAGEPVLLLHPPGLEYVTAFSGCLYAGAIAVPAYPPDPGRLQRTLPRLSALLADAGATIALTTGAIRAMAGFLFEQAPDLALLRWVASDAIDDASAGAWRAPAIQREDIALLQYTSGSTGTPRGVMLSHGNLLHNSGLIHRCFGHGPGSRGVIWLPPYHDMGLIGGVLQPLCGGFPVTLLSPLHFLERPLRWLRAISRYQATTSGGPNFAYDLCVRKISPAERETLDLRSWDLAFNGAEPIRAETLDRFATAFAPAGFRREALYPCYGLAEGTLIASGGEKGAPPIVRSFARANLASGRATLAKEAKGAEATALVSSGRCAPEQRILIVHPETRAPCAPGEIGEIWLAGPSVAQGYWRRQAETDATFRALPEGAGDTPFLRTGDLGFFEDGELFVVGRSKDLIIIRGRNHYPQDIEQTVERSHPGVRPGCSAAFSVETGGEERLAVVAEIDPRRGADPAAVIDAIREDVAREHELLVHAVVVLRPGGIPKTSSGKVQRRACREQLLGGALEPLGSHLAAEEAPAERAALTRSALLAVAPAERMPLVVEHLCAEVARLLRVAPARIDPARALIGQGLDSLSAVELRSALEIGLGVSLPLRRLFEDRGLDALARDVLAALAEPGDAATPRIAPVARRGPLPLSFAQQRLWFLHQLAPSSPVYNLPVALKLTGPLDAAALAFGLDALVRRHEVLRATFTVAAGELAQVVREHRPAALLIEDLSGLAPAEAEEAARRIAAEEARCPFDLTEGPLFRARLLRTEPEQHLLLVTIHHIVTDGWSMGVLTREIEALYRARRAGAEAALLPLPIQYGDFAEAERRWLDEARCQAHLDHFRRRLGGAPPLLTLRDARRRPAVQTFRGAHHTFEIPAALLGDVEELCQREEVTLFMALLAAFLLVLRTEGGGDDLVVGTDAAGRTWAGTAGLVGLFVNQLVLRADLSGDPSGRELLRRVRALALDAYAHAELPFDKLVEGLRPARNPGHNPFFQVMFVLENAPLTAPALPGLAVELLPMESVGSPFDISLLLTPAPGAEPWEAEPGATAGLAALLKFNPDLFEPAVMARIAEAFTATLAALGARPEASIGELTAQVAEALGERLRAEIGRLREAQIEKWKSVKRRSKGTDGHR